MTIQQPKRATHMPKVWAPAWHGPIGEAVVKIAPSTEADPAAVLATGLALFGAMAGDTPHVRVGGVRHPPRIWPLIIGRTGRGRKGTSLAEARRLAREWGPYAAPYEQKRVVPGLSSGEGLIGALGGGQAAADPDKEPAAPDGRLTLTESEFARTLTAIRRDGSTLGPVLRQLWDDGSAAVLTRTAPLRVDNAHVTVVAHITPAELRARLQESDIAGGTLNRFLLVASEQPHLLAHEPPYADVMAQAEWLGKALDRARHDTGHLRRDRAADDLWTEVYAALSADEPDGHLGAVMARGPVYTMRLALTYALADGAGAIGVEHLVAGLAMWAYAADSARLLFPQVRHDVEVEKLLNYLASTPTGATRTDISALFGRNKLAVELDTLLDEVLRTHDARVERTADGPGRPTERYFTTGRLRDPVARILTRFS